VRDAGDFAVAGARFGFGGGKDLRLKGIALRIQECRTRSLFGLELSFHEGDLTIPPSTDHLPLCLSAHGRGPDQLQKIGGFDDLNVLVISERQEVAVATNNELSMSKGGAFDNRVVIWIRRTTFKAPVMAMTLEKARISSVISDVCLGSRPRLS